MEMDLRTKKWLKSTKEVKNLFNQKKFMIESIFTFNLFLLGFVRYVTEYTYI